MNNKTMVFDNSELEENVDNIEDKTERELTIGLQAIGRAIRYNKDNITLVMLYNNKKAELEEYQQSMILDYIDEENMWMEMSKCLGTVRIEVIQ